MANKHEFQKQIYVYISNDDDPEDRVMIVCNNIEAAGEDGDLVAIYELKEVCMKTIEHKLKSI